MGSPEARSWPLGIQSINRPVPLQKGLLPSASSVLGSLSLPFQTKQIPTSLTLSPNSSHFVTISLPSRHINIFNFHTGKLTRTYDESLAAIQEMQQAGTAVYKVDDMEFGRRLAVERELEKDERAWRTMRAAWDESGNFVMYPTLLGIKGGCGVYRVIDLTLILQALSGQYRHEQGLKAFGQR